MVCNCNIQGPSFNLKRGGLWVFFGVKINVFASLCSGKTNLPTTCRNISFFLQKHFLMHKVLSKYLYLPMLETEFFFHQICRPKIIFQKNPQHPTPFKLNGCSLRKKITSFSYEIKYCVKKRLGPLFVELLWRQLIYWFNITN